MTQFRSTGKLMLLEVDFDGKERGDDGGGRVQREPTDKFISLSPLTKTLLR